MNGYHISQLAKRYVEHDMIQAHTELPAFPNARVELMFAFLNRSKPIAEHSELFALVTSLVQVGLDTHDTIELAAVQHNDRNLRSRQLKVLAGDYFSSRFYNLLAQQGQIDTVRALSQSVCDINRLKMTMVDKMKHWTMTAEEYLRASVTLKKSLFQSFNAQMNQEDISTWEELLDSLTELEVLEREQERADHFERFEGSWSYWHVWQQGTDEERRKLKQKLVDEMLWNALMSKYEVREQLAYQVRVSRDKLHTLAVTLPLDESTRQRLDTFLALPRL
ncbi:MULTISPECIES: heptaprenyl diphosphate synthase component 1 [Paenibacillus]|uniref:Heptaprenyl diphosphate synthase component 1 n=3 Tax=Paenibacillus TaxID=44249 RepID=A0AAJ2JSC7_9BACL|nr:MULTISPECIES: heptaprenyl diphosphate synthase component 1 [Paenibacillus]GAV11135.1 heptaprenyl diphosphate synthase (HEPPP synthase) subunit 1 [Paenibacillus sp. NAIST15-1]EPY12426.1 hypothetical protein PAAL66ix_13361 [Paenibacillus alvei A6-6i-x]MCM3289762.1 heptaprenyl diphosphate synthase component 1 [Paenibacillus sp. MER 180]MDT8976090.1 heptaprenyl diphosphate synthase component 1 [Paenibacillus sp. chi10]OBY80635.1 heptaprenyl diphosphate synthase [Paenibacillus sp. KS1]